MIVRERAAVFLMIDERDEPDGAGVQTVVSIYSRGGDTLNAHLMSFANVDASQAIADALSFLAGYIAGRMQLPPELGVRMLLDASGRRPRG